VTIGSAGLSQPGEHPGDDDSDDRNLEERFASLSAGLKAETGRSYDEWGAFIAGMDRNTAIDTLRLEGFSWQQASRIERSHACGQNPFFAREATRKGHPKRREPPTPNQRLAGRQSDLSSDGQCVLKGSLEEPRVWRERDLVKVIQRPNQNVKALKYWEKR